MKYLFAASLAVLLLCSVGLRLSYPDVSSDRPVLYWITDKNPARAEQVEAFERWLVDNGHTAEDGGPAVELRLDTSNAELTKKVIQSVSGVGSDLMDAFSGTQMRLLAAMDVISPVDGAAEELGFSLDDTYDVLAPEISIDGTQYMYPCNVAARSLIVNPEAFSSLGLPQPPRRWTIEEFEAAGRAYVRAANPPGTAPADRKFFVDSVPIEILWRGFGASALNETGTASGFDTGGFRDALLCWRRWIYEDRILPSPDDTAAFASAQGYGGAVLSLFGRGNYAMVNGGRWFLIQLRTYPNLRNLAAVEPPHAVFPNTLISTRAATVYAGGDRQDLAHLFLAYLASDEYNALIVRDADALPPNPAAVRTEAYLRPADHPDEWNYHGPHAEIAMEIGIGGSYSPFVQSNEIIRERETYQQLFEIGQISVDEAVARAHGAVNRRIRSTLERKPGLRPEYERRLAIQAAVDERKAAGEPIPENWVFNAFHTAYYGRTGRLGPAEPFPAGGEPVADDADARPAA